MKTNRAIIFTSILVAFMAVCCAPNGDKSSTDVDNSRGEGALDSTKKAHFDTSHPTSSVTNFITSTIKSNKGELQLLQLGEDKLTSPQLKQEAAMMIKDHKQMNTELQALAAQKNAPVDSSANEVTQAAETNLSALSGKNFDDKWTAQLLQLHENTFATLNTMNTMTTDPQLKQWLAKTIPVIVKHRDMLAKKPSKEANLQTGQMRD